MLGRQNLLPINLHLLGSIRLETCVNIFHWAVNSKACFPVISYCSRGCCRARNNVSAVRHECDSMSQNAPYDWIKWGRSLILSTDAASEATQVCALVMQSRVRPQPSKVGLCEQRAASRVKEFPPGSCNGISDNACTSYTSTTTLNYPLLPLCRLGHQALQQTSVRLKWLIFYHPGV